MSRITGNDAKGLMEAYGAVYTPQELTEEQVWEEVETWVNSLLEEGYDLSDYTWEEMYESYLEEQGRGRSPRASGGVSQDSFSRWLRGDGPARTLSASDRSRMNARPGPAPIPRMANLGAGYKSAELQQSAKASASQVGTTRTGAGGVSVGGGNAGASRQAPTARPAAAPATPGVTTVPIRPRTPAAAPATPGVTTVPIRPRTPAAAPAPAARTPGATPAPATTKVAPAPAGGSALDRATAAAGRPAAGRPAAFSPKPQSDVGKMIDASKARQAAQTPKPATPAPAARPMGNARERMLQRQSFDVFDVVKGHLIDEGYADTEEAALVIMANMSESWKNSIIG
jgi:hypothetical protein